METIYNNCVLNLLKGNLCYIYVQDINRVQLTQLSGDFFGLRLFQLVNASQRFWTGSIVTLVVADFIVSLPVVGPGSFHLLRGVFLS